MKRLLFSLLCLLAVTSSFATPVLENGLRNPPISTTAEESDVIEYGTHTIDGITYRLYSAYKNLRADVLPYSDTENYSGDLFIPDFVEYENNRFNIWTISNSVTQNNPELTSISLSVCLPHSLIYLAHCDKLKNIELRDGVLQAPGIWGCPMLESITFPVSCTSIKEIVLCENLKSITFLGTEKLEIENLQLLPSLTDIFFSAQIPPSLGSWVLIDKSNLKIHVPEGSAEAYRRNGWSESEIIEDRSPLSVNVIFDYCGNRTSSSTEGGYAVGRGSNYVESAFRIPSSHISAYKNCKITAIEFLTPALWENDNGWEDIEYVFITKPGKDYLVKESATTRRGSWTRVELSNPYIITGEELFIGVGRYHVLSMWFANDDVVADGNWGRCMGSDHSEGMQPGVWEQYHGIWYWNHPLPIRAVIEGEVLPNDIVIASTELVRSETEPNTNSAIKHSSETSDASKTAQYVAPVFLASATDGDVFTYTFNGEGNYSVPQKKANYSSDKNADYLKGKKADYAPKSSVIAASGDKMRLLLRNRSPRTVKEITLDVNVDGITGNQITINTYLQTNDEEYVYVDLPEISGRNSTVDFNVSEIDGEPDEISANSVSEILYSTPSKTYFPRKVVIEEACGTWCESCPKGYATMDYLSRLYPDNFIPISVHDDEMYPVDGSYDPIFQSAPSIPIIYINRTQWKELVFPSEIDIDDMIDKAEAMIKAEAAFTDDGRIEISTETVFGFDDSGSDKYRIAFVLLEDNVGPYTQVNGYSRPDIPDDPDNFLNWWNHQPEFVETTFNNVARSVTDTFGIPGLIPDIITEGEMYPSSYTISIHPSIQNPANLKIVALLLDNTTGEILNADLSGITGTVPNKPVRVESVTFDQEFLSGYEGDTFTITATVLPDDAAIKTLSWTSDDETIATVDNEGFVSMIKPGVCFVHATTTDGSYITADCLILSNSGIDAIFADDSGLWDVYNLAGTIVLRDATAGQIRLLSPGIYIFRQGSRTIKIFIK